MQITWSPLALERLEEIVSYLSAENPQAAETWLDNVFSSVERLEEFPMSGRVMPEIGISRIREIILDNYRIIYSNRERIEILTVRTRWQELTPSALQQDESQ